MHILIELPDNVANQLQLEPANIRNLINSPICRTFGFQVRTNF
ncbi:hypothetical protein [Nostoc sp. NOS(2021)]|nr:hypothetical protein [Nostoc sp. NOS(2021)]